MIQCTQDTAVVILSYNGRKWHELFLPLIVSEAHTGYDVVVVDNASTECDPQDFLKEFPQLILVRSEVNGGFAYGNNLGIEKANGNYILLLNSDTILKENSVCFSWNYLKNHEAVGVLGCRMIFPDGMIQYTARKFRSIKWELLDLFRFIPNMMPYKKRSRLMLGKYFKCDESIECDWVNGAFFMFEKKVLEQLPQKKLDDHFFMYGEDQLWCEQIKDLGYKILFYSDTTIIHINNASTDIKKQLSLRKVMMRHELEIMRIRKGKTPYYYLFALIYGTKESIRNFVKRIIFMVSGNLIK